MPASPTCHRVILPNCPTWGGEWRIRRGNSTICIQFRKQHCGVSVTFPEEFDVLMPLFCGEIRLMVATLFELCAPGLPGTL